MDRFAGYAIVVGHKANSQNGSERISPRWDVGLRKWTMTTRGSSIQLSLSNSGICWA